MPVVTLTSVLVVPVEAVTVDAVVLPDCDCVCEPDAELCVCCVGVSPDTYSPNGDRELTLTVAFPLSATAYRVSALLSPVSARLK